MTKVYTKLCLLFVAFVLGACDRADGVHRYTEILVPPSREDPHAHLGKAPRALPAMQQSDSPEIQRMLSDSLAELPLSWEKPAGWDESPGSGMRLASFQSRGQDPVTTTIVSLGGMAGNLQSNVLRWAQQIGLEAAPDEFNTFLSSITTEYADSGMAYQFIDFSLLQNASRPEDESMKTAIMRTEEATVFIKMTGSYRAVTSQHEAFRNLVHSIKVNDE